MPAVPSMVATSTRAPRASNSSLKNTSSPLPKPRATVTAFPRAASSLASRYRGGTPTPPPIRRGLSPLLSRLKPFPRPDSTSRATPEAKAVISPEPWPSTL